MTWAISGVTRGMKVQATWHQTWGHLELEWPSAKLLECMMLVVGAWHGMGDTCHDLSHVSSLMQTCLGLVEKHGMDQAKGKEFFLWGISSRERREMEKRGKKEEKENHKEGQREE